MKASKLIKKLADEINKHGDLEVMITTDTYILGSTNFDVFNGSLNYEASITQDNGRNTFENHIIIDRP